MAELALAIGDLFDHELALDTAISRHFAENYRQRTNGTWDDRTRFRAHIAHLRTVVDTVTVTVLDELARGRSYAERHVVDIAKRDGTRVVQEVYVFGAVADDGRFACIEEVTHMLAGNEADRTIANAR